MMGSRVLLIVDDQAVVARSLRRYLARSFDTVHAASDPLEAELLLASAEPAVTHVVCDYFLGNGVPFGTVLLAKWRKQFSSIRVAVILSGSELEAIKAERGIDAVLTKPADLDRLCQVLGVPPTFGPQPVV